MRYGVTRGRLAFAGLALAAPGLVVLAPELFGERTRAGIAGAAHADPRGLWLAAALFCGVIACSGLAWCTVLRGCGARLAPHDACARYATGSLVNSLAPARIGTAVRIALFSRVLEGEGRLLTAAGAGAAVGAARAAWTAALVGTAALAGGVPAWPAAVAAGAVAAGAGAVLVAHRFRPRRRIAHVLDAFRALAGRPARAARLLGWAGAASLSRVAAAAVVAQAVGLEQPVLAALLVVAAVDVSAALPVTPGNLGVGAAAVALVLTSSGVASRDAIATGIAFTAVETATSIAVGALGTLLLVDRPGLRRGVALSTAAAGCAVVAAAFGATVVLPFL
jgi:phosphatidylinositol alpha-mannosyltransferase